MGESRGQLHRDAIADAYMKIRNANRAPDKPYFDMTTAREDVDVFGVAFTKAGFSLVRKARFESLKNDFAALAAEKASTDALLEEFLAAYKELRDLGGQSDRMDRLQVVIYERLEQEAGK